MMSITKDAMYNLVFKGRTQGSNIVCQMMDTIPYQEDRVEAWLGFPLPELLLGRLQHSCVLTGSLS